MSPDEESTHPAVTVSLKGHYDDRPASVVPVVSPVVVGVGRRDREYCKQSGKQQNHDLFHFCSSNFSMMDLCRDLTFEFPTQPFFPAQRLNRLPAA
jgi:hypothetical protein